MGRRETSRDQTPALDNPTLGRGRGGGDGSGQADIVWINRGNANDRFDAVFGVGAGKARSIIDQVILDFEKVITDFNRISPGSNNTLNLTISMGVTNGLGGLANFITYDGEGKPTAGRMTLQAGNNGAGSGYFLDPTPAEHSEFRGNITSAFALDAASPSPAFGLYDFYSLAALEATHLMGIANDAPARLQTSGYLIPPSGTGITDNAEGNGVGEYFVFSGPNITHLMTSYDSGGSDTGAALHGAGPDGPVNYAGNTFYGAEDIMNASYESGRRYLIGDAPALIIQDAMGYTVNTPSSLHLANAYINLDTTTKELLVRGPDGTSDDVIGITYDANASTITVIVDPTVDTPGTGALPGAGNLPAYTAVFSTAQISSVVINGNGGNDQITIFSIDNGTPIVIDAGSGNDTISLGSGELEENLPGTVNISGSAGADRLELLDNLNGSSDEYTLTATTFDKDGIGLISWNGVDDIAIDASGTGNSTFHLIEVAVPTLLLTGSGDSIVNVASGNLVAQIAADLSLIDLGGVDTLVLNDSTDLGDDGYTVNGGIVSKTTGWQRVLHNGVDALRLDANLGNNLITVTNSDEGVITINGGNGNDTVVVGGGDLDAQVGQPSVIGGGGIDVVRFDDTADQVDNDVYYFTSPGVFSKSSSSPYYYSPADTERVELLANAGSNIIHIDAMPNGVTLVVNAGEGNDNIEVGTINGMVDGVLGNVSLAGGSGQDAFTIFNGLRNSQLLTHYAVRFDRVDVSTAGTLFYADIDDLLIYDSAGDSTATVHSLPVGVNVTLAAGAGADTYTLGDPTTGLSGFADAGNILFLLAGSSSNEGDHFIVNDAPGLASDAYDIDFDGNFVTLERLALPHVKALSFLTTLNASGGANTLRVKASQYPMIVNGNGGNDTFVLGKNSTLGQLSNYVTLNGGSGTDSLTVDNAAGPDARSFVIDAAFFGYNGLPDLFGYGTMELLQFYGGNIANVTDTFTVLGTSTTTIIDGGNSADIYYVRGTSSGNPVQLRISTDDEIEISSQPGANSQAVLLNSASLARLYVFAGGKCILPVTTFGDQFIRTGSFYLDAASGAALDLGNNLLAVDYTAGDPSPLGELTGQIIAARNNGAWTGARGIGSALLSASSMYTLGIAEASAALGTAGGTLGGAIVDGTCVLLRYTRLGDTNLDRQVSFSDLLTLAQNYANPSQRYYQHGDFNFDGLVNFNDLLVLAQNYGAAFLSGPDVAGGRATRKKGSKFSLE